MTLSLGLCRFVLLGVLALFSASGCVTDDYAMRATENVRVTPGLKEGATYRIPLANPVGSVRLLTEGRIELRGEPENQAVPTLHVRMVLNNQASPLPWSLNVQEQIISFPNGEKARPVYVNTGNDEPPEVAVAPGKKEVVDLFYTVPLEYRGEDNVDGFRLNWLVNLPDEKVTEVTSFEKIRAAGYPVIVRQEVETPFVGGDDDLGFGPIWWRDPSEPLASAPPLWQ